MGDRDAAQRLGTMLQQGRVDPVSALEALGESGDTRAVPGVMAQVADRKPEVRGAAAEALGKIGGNAQSVRDQLTRLLSDDSPHVRTKAASALYRMNDPAGLTLLRELASSDLPVGRLVAADAMSSHPDAAWMALVGELAQSGTEPEVRLGAAKLIAPHDPAMAQSVAREYERHENVALRELSAQVMCEAATGDSLGALRQLLRSGDERTRLRAADRILTLTR
jgi:HEAT repeat protein